MLRGCVVEDTPKNRFLAEWRPPPKDMVLLATLFASFRRATGRFSVDEQLTE
jgi:hypothetical protein